MTRQEYNCDVIMLATKEIEDYAQHSSALWAAYCKRKGYHFFRYADRLIPDMHVNWSKIEMVRRHLSKSTADVVTLVDADTYICNPDLSMKTLMDRAFPSELVFSADTSRYGFLELPLNIRAAIEHRQRRLPNAGFIVMRNSRFVRRFFDDWLDLARNELSHLSDLHPRNQRVLWKGLLLQNRSQIKLLDGEVRRLQHERQLERAMHHGCDVAHVRRTISPERVRELTRSIEKMPAQGIYQTTAPDASGRPVLKAIKADVVERVLYGPAVLKLNVERVLARASSQSPIKDDNVIVSLTSFPDRFPKLHTCIKSLLAQSVQPFRTVLYLVHDECSEADIPPKLQALCGERFEIRFVETNVRSLNKIYHALKDFPQKTIVTCDDDKIYPSRWLERLVATARARPGCIVCNRSREIALMPGKQVAPYREWRPTCFTEPSLAVLPMGVGGVLYPKGSLHPDVLKADLFRELCETSDDLWLKIMSLRKGTTCAQVRNVPEKYPSIPFWNGRKLSPGNIWDGGNDQNLHKLITYFDLDMHALLAADETAP